MGSNHSREGLPKLGANNTFLAQHNLPDANQQSSIFGEPLSSKLQRGQAAKESKPEGRATRIRAVGLTTFKASPRRDERLPSNNPFRKPSPPLGTQTMATQSMHFGVDRSHIQRELEANRRQRSWHNLGHRLTSPLRTHRPESKLSVPSPTAFKFGAVQHPEYQHIQGKAQRSINMGQGQSSPLAAPGGANWDSVANRNHNALTEQSSPQLANVQELELPPPYSENENWPLPSQTEQLVDDIHDALGYENALEALDEVERYHNDQALAVALQAEEDVEAADAPPPRQTRSCLICTDELDFDDFPILPPTSACDHGVNTCTTCLQRSIASDLDSKGWEHIHCPECRLKLQHTEVQTAAAPEDFERYDKLSTRTALSHIPDFQWCLNPNCTSGHVNPDHLLRFRCDGCHKEFCTKHQREWHNGETCEQYDIRTSSAGRRRQELEENASKREVEASSVKCPNKKCEARIQKTHGCDHMKCTKCGTKFCYQCQALYTEISRRGGDAHGPNCPYQTNNLRRSGLKYLH